MKYVCIDTGCSLTKQQLNKISKDYGVTYTTMVMDITDLLVIPANRSPYTSDYDNTIKAEQYHIFKVTDFEFRKYPEECIRASDKTEPIRKAKSIQFESSITEKIEKGIALLKDEDPYNIKEIDNKRFIYNPITKELVLGSSKNNGIDGDFEEDYESVRARGSFKDTITGWVGTSKHYTDGIIHFAPPILKETMIEYPEEKDKVYKTIEHFKKHGATNNTIVRNCVKMGEQPLSKVLPVKAIPMTFESMINEGNRIAFDGGAYPRYDNALKYLWKSGSPAGTGAFESEVFPKTDILVTDFHDTNSENIRKAKEYGVPIISYNDFLKALIEHPEYVKNKEWSKITPKVKVIQFESLFNSIKELL